MNYVAEKSSVGSVAVGRCDFFGKPPYSETAEHLTRRFLTRAHAAALETLAQWMRAAGMSVRLDEAGNFIGRYEASEPGAPALIIGSHIDSVQRAGRYDGALGIMLGLGCVEVLAAVDRRFPFAVEVVAFGDEEGSRFPTSMIGSRAMAGGFEVPVGNYIDSDGISLAEAFSNFGLDAAKISRAARMPGEVLGYIEAHIEQGPVLEAEGLPVGIVTEIASQLRMNVSVKGAAGHAGTTPMEMRRDALVAAAEAILALEDIASAGSRGLVATVGKIEVLPASTNVIPGEAHFSVDLRAPDVPERDGAAASFHASLEEIARTRHVSIELAVHQDLPACKCDPDLSEILAAAIEDLGMPSFRLSSGAGHDAMSVAKLAPVAMLFIRCAGGVSHNPREAVEAADVDWAAQVLLGFMDRLAQRHAHA